MKRKWTSNLIVDAGNPAVRIEVIDSNFEIRARGYHRIEETLPTGIYKVRYQAGDASIEKLIKLEPNATVQLLKPPKLEFGSAAPMEQTHTSHEVHQTHAHELSHTTQLEHGHGSELFLFVRDLEPGGKSHPMQGMSLHALDGTQLVDLERNSQRSTNRNEAAWAGCTIVLDPGSYRLRLALRKAPIVETVVVACPGWQSQFFLLRENRKSAPNRFELLDISNATQLMAKPEKGFNPYQDSSRPLSLNRAAEDIRLAELARLAVANQWRGFHTKDLNALLRGKFYDPMLGILGLHLLLMRPEPDLKSAARIHQRLQQEVLDGFPHPDVQALGIEIAHRQGKTISHAPVESPPMLRRSWFFLLKATAEQPSLILEDSFCALISDRLWGNGAWLSWVLPESKGGRWVEKDADFMEQTPGKRQQASRQDPRTKEDFESVRNAMVAFLPSLEKLIRKYKDVEKLAKKANLDEGEFGLLAYLHTTLQINTLKQGSSPDSSLSWEVMVSSLGIPADRIHVLMTGLLEKLRPLVKTGR